MAQPQEGVEVIFFMEKEIVEKVDVQVTQLPIS